MGRRLDPRGHLHVKAESSASWRRRDEQRPPLYVGPPASRSADRTGSKRFNVGRLLAFRALLYFKADLLVLLQRLETVRLYFRKVRKQIFTALIRRDEAKTFCVVEPLYGTGCHLLIFLGVPRYESSRAY